MTTEYKPKNSTEAYIIQVKCKFCKYWLIDGCHLNNDPEYLFPLESCEEFMRKPK